MARAQRLEQEGQDMGRLFKSGWMTHPVQILLSGLLLLGWQGAVNANPIQIGSQIVVPFETETVIDLSNVNLGDDTGVRVKNLTQDGNDKSISVELIPGASDLGFQAPDGFVLLDNTLHVTSNLTPGGRRIRARMDFGRYNGGRAGIRAMGVRFNSIRLLRADFNTRRWIPAVNAIRDQSIVPIRFLTGIRANLALGHYGIDKQNEFVWAVLDTAGEQFFAIGGLSAIPLPAAWLLFLTGSGMLVLVARRRRSEAS